MQRVLAAGEAGTRLVGLGKFLIGLVIVVGGLVLLIFLFEGARSFSSWVRDHIGFGKLLLAGIPIAIVGWVAVGAAGLAIGVAWMVFIWIFAAMANP
jgi:hypothetical protein